MNTEQDTEFLLRRVWAFAHIFFMVVGLGWVEQIQTGDWLGATLPLIMIILAVLTVYRPENLIFKAMLVTQIGYAISTLPELQNHRYLVMFVNAGLLALSKDGRYFNEKCRWYISRLLIVTYFYATFHKINHDFLNPATSCATQFLSHASENLQILRIIPGAWLPYGTVVLEGLLVLLLLFHRFWKMAAFVAIFFHLGLTFDYEKLFINFTGIMISLFTIITCTKGCYSIFLNRFTIFSLPPLLTVLLLAIFYGVIDRQLYVFLVHTIFLFWIGGLSVLVAKNSVVSQGRSSLSAALLATLFLLNGAAPYLGVKNRGSLNMYSNLLVSKNYSNHLLIPRSLDIFGFNGVSPSLPLGKLFPFRPVEPEDKSACVW